MGYNAPRTDKQQARMSIQSLNPTDLLRNLHHAVHRPLTSIVNLTDMLLLGFQGDLSPEVQQDILEMSDDAQRLQRVMITLLEWVTMSTSEYHFQELDLAGVIQTVVRQMEEQNPGMKVQLQLVPAPVLVEADSRTITQVISKLFSHMDRFRGSHDLHVELQIGEGIATVSIWMQKDREDTAQGGSDDNLQQYLKDELSLGLLMCQQILKAHRSDLGIRYAPSDSLAFYFSLPLLSR